MKIEINKIKLSGITIVAENEEEMKKIPILIPDFLKKKNEKKKYNSEHCDDDCQCGTCPVRDDCEDYEAPYEGCNGDCNNCNHNAACTDVEFECPDHMDCNICEYRDRCPEADEDEDDDDDDCNNRCNCQNECSVHDKEATIADPADKDSKKNKIQIEDVNSFIDSFEVYSDIRQLFSILLPKESTDIPRKLMRDKVVKYLLFRVNNKEE